MTLRLIDLSVYASKSPIEFSKTLPWLHRPIFLSNGRFKLPNRLLRIPATGCNFVSRILRETLTLFTILLFYIKVTIMELIFQLKIPEHYYHRWYKTRIIGNDKLTVDVCAFVASLNENKFYVPLLNSTFVACWNFPSFFSFSFFRTSCAILRHFVTFWSSLHADVCNNADLHEYSQFYDRKLHLTSITRWKITVLS